MKVVLVIVVIISVIWSVGNAYSQIDGVLGGGGGGNSSERGAIIGGGLGIGLGNILDGLKEGVTSQSGALVGGGQAGKGIEVLLSRANTGLTGQHSGVAGLSPPPPPKKLKDSDKK